MMYHELVYHLDLCILSYHLYTQTLIWPMDPYYEQIDKGSVGGRDTFMKSVRSIDYPLHPPYPPDIDPVVSDYRGISPWSPCFVKALPTEPWLVFDAPSQIAAQIRTTVMYGQKLVRSLQGDEVQAELRLDVLEEKENPSRQGTDYLYCFEGETGLVQASANADPKSGLKSMMGFVLDEQIDNQHPELYNVHIVFRGSRSGDAARAARQGLANKGNPDWITDMDSLRQKVEDPRISQEGECARGFRNSIVTMMPTIFKVLSLIQTRRGALPKTIYVTGHSLGGALATHFASAVSIGNILNNSGNVDLGLREWPWENLKLITFGAPGAGNSKFAYAFNKKVYTKRVVLGTDPITFTRTRGSSIRTFSSEHVGAKIKIPTNLKGTDQHKPNEIRTALIKWAEEGGDNLTNVPREAPWQECRKFREVLNHHAFNTEESICNALSVFRLPLYFDCLKKSLTSSRSSESIRAKESLITDFSNSMNVTVNFRDAQYIDYYNSYYKKMGEKFGSNFGKFLGLCMILFTYTIDKPITDFNSTLNDVPDDL